MDHLTSHQIAVLFLSLGVLLAVARMMGDLARRMNQPSVVGELLAGVLLGPTVVGHVWPRWMLVVHPGRGPIAFAQEGLITVAVSLFMLVAGMEVDLKAVFRQSRAAMRVAFGGIVAPFGLGLLAAWLLPTVLGRERDGNALIFALFFATAMSISALPVIARTLMDLDLYQTDLGIVVIAAAAVNDVIGWIIFAIILGMIGGPSHGSPSVGYTVVITLCVAAFMLTVGRWMIARVLAWLAGLSDSPGGVATFVLALALLGAAFTEWSGAHALFGCFLAGVAIGDARHLGPRVRDLLRGFISLFFAPLFFASIGLQVDFVAYFHWDVVVLVLVVACIGKLLGCGVAARLSGMSSRESWAVAFGMNSRGAMEIILGLLALQYQVIREPLFVALVIMALATSVMGGPLMRRTLGRGKAMVAISPFGN